MERTVSRSAPDAIDTADVRAFVRVVDLGSMTAAAASVGETKGSVSRRVSRLEAALGLPLVHRTGRRVVPTEDGLAYRQKAGLALDQLDDAFASVREGHGRPSGHLRVTAPVGFGTVVLGPLLGEFAETYPDVTVELVMTDSVLSFGQDRIDVALRLTGGLPDSSLVASKLLDLRMVLVASPEYVARHGMPERPEDLAAHRMLAPPRRGTSVPLTVAPIDDPGAETEHVLPGHLLSHDMILLHHAAVGGAGVALMIAEMASGELERGRLVEVMTGYRVVSRGALYMLVEGGKLTSKTRAFRDFVRARWEGRALGCPSTRAR